MVQTINELFRAYFAKIGCRAKVELEQAGENYANYGIGIFVSFRDNDNFQRLTAETQSGGVSQFIQILLCSSLNLMLYRAC